MRILGIDPGSRVTGYGVIDLVACKPLFIGCGVLKPAAGLPLAERLRHIYQGVCEVIAQEKPDMMAVEDVFVSVNPRSALKLGHARGVIILAGMQNELPVHEFPAKVVKQAVAGYGQAAKAQVQQMVRILLKLSACPSQDASDALAVALCCANHSLLSGRG